MNEVEDKVNSMKNDYLLLRSLENEFAKVQDKDTPSPLKHELFALKFTLTDGKVYPYIRLGEHEHPTYEQFGAEGLDYLNHRLTETKNKYLKARYNQILYNSKLKNNAFLKEAINAYLEILNDPVIFLEDEIASELQFVFSNFAHLGAESKSNHQIVQNEFDRLFNSSLKPTIKKRLLEVAINVKKIFKGKDLKVYYSKWKELYETILTENDNRKKEAYANTGVLLAQKTSNDVSYWYNELGDCHRDDTLRELAGANERAMIAAIHCDKAIRAYKNAGNSAMVDEMRNHRIAIKDKFELPIHTIDLDIDKEYFLRLQSLTENMQNTLFGLSTTDMYHQLSGDIGVFPDIESLTKYVGNKKLLQDWFARVYYDSNNNVASKASSEEDRKEMRFYEHYTYHIQMIVLPILDTIFKQGTIEDKINCESLLNHFAQSSWMGKTRIRKGSNTDWVGMISLQIDEFFAEIIRRLTYPEYMNPPVLLLDSLVTKFEGAFRTLCKLHGINITLETNEGQREKFLHELIYDKEVLKVLGKDDVIFFRYLYTKKGLDLRNKIAHSFMLLEDYSMNQAYLVVMSFLRLARYDFRPKTNETDDKN